MKAIYVYIMTNQRNGTLYVGTTDLVKRVWEHKSKIVPGLPKSIICVRLFIMKFTCQSCKLHEVRDVLRIGAVSGKLI